MVSKVTTFAAIAAVGIILVVLYETILQAPQNVWNIENNAIYNVHLFQLPKLTNGISFVQEIVRQNEPTEIIAPQAVHDNVENGTYEQVLGKDSRPAPHDSVIPSPKDAFLSTGVSHEFPKSRAQGYSTPPVSTIRDVKATGPQLPAHSPRSPYNPNTEAPVLKTTPESWGAACSTPLCLQYLSAPDKANFQSCLNKASKPHHPLPKESKYSCHFMDGRQRHPVALISLPGSGNTWVRGLLQKATGICTGAIYCDVSMRAKGFPGEGVSSGSVLVTKTHGSAPLWVGTYNKRSDRRTHFGSAIFIVRNPLDALVAEWNRKVSNNFRGSTVTLLSHVNSANKEWFGNNKKWEMFVQAQTKRWQTMLKTWIMSSSNSHPVLVVRYEDLQKGTEFQVKRMLEFLKIPYSEKELQRKLANGFSSFQRTHHEEFEHYTLELKNSVKLAVSGTIKLLEHSHLGGVVQMDDYLT